MHFDQITGYTNLKNQLLGMALSKRAPHAQIFLGPAGSGKLALALAFAQLLLCENATENGACNECNACKKATKHIHPDIHFSFPTIGSKVTSNLFLEQWRSAIADNPYMDVNQWLRLIGAENKQGNITVDECNNIIKKLSLKIFEGSHKILIMWLPEYLRKEGNRLLKLIEEPPENTIFIFVAEDQELILPTILSRCQLTKVKPYTDAEIKTAILQTKPELEDQITAIAHLANGNLNEAFKLTEINENDQAVLFLEWLRKCYKGNGVELVKWVEGFSKLGRENQKHFVRYALHFIREFLNLKTTGAVQVRLRDKELESAKKLSNVMGFEQVQKITLLLNDCYYYIERNANPKILFLDTSIKMNQILKTDVAVA